MIVVIIDHAKIRVLIETDEPFDRWAESASPHGPTADLSSSYSETIARDIEAIALYVSARSRRITTINTPAEIASDVPKIRI